MITAEQKPLEEIIEYMRPFQRILLVGCNECVTVCAAGGRKEVGILSSLLQMSFLKQGKLTGSGTYPGTPMRSGIRGGTDLHG